MDLRYKAYAKTWTKGSIFCYERGCNCNGCFVKDLITSQPCIMKNAVIELVKKLGKPPEKANKPIYTEQELKIIELIKQGLNRFEITELMDLNYGQMSSKLRDLYAKAREEGLKFKNNDTRRHLEEYREWLESEG